MQLAAVLIVSARHRTNTSKSIVITTSVAVTEESFLKITSGGGDVRTVDRQLCDKAELNHRLFDFLHVSEY